MIDDKAHHAGVAVFGWVSDQREAADHSALDQIAVSAARSVLSLRGKNTIIVAVIGNRCCGNLITFTPHSSHDRTKRTLRLTSLRLPIQTVLLTGITDKLLSIFQQGILVPILHRVLALRIDDCEQRLNRRQLIFTDPPVENFLFAFISIE